MRGSVWDTLSSSLTRLRSLCGLEHDLGVPWVHKKRSRKYLIPVYRLELGVEPTASVNSMRLGKPFRENVD
jgi:hypothetical protein